VTLVELTVSSSVVASQAGNANVRQDFRDGFFILQWVTTCVLLVEQLCKVVSPCHSESSLRAFVAAQLCVSCVCV
jgi:hypothetical protein